MCHIHRKLVLIDCRKLTTVMIAYCLKQSAARIFSPGARDDARAGSRLHRRWAGALVGKEGGIYGVVGELMEEAGGLVAEVSLHMRRELFDNPEWRAWLSSATHQTHPWTTDRFRKCDRINHFRVQVRLNSNRTSTVTKQIGLYIYMRIFHVQQVHIMRNCWTPAINRGFLTRNVGIVFKSRGARHCCLSGLQRSCGTRGSSIRRGGGVGSAHLGRFLLLRTSEDSEGGGQTERDHDERPARTSATRPLVDELQPTS